MTIFQIECFLNVAKYLNFTEAANHLFIAQSSLSRNISNLETELGIQLFSRTKKYVRLTPGGAVLYQELSVLLDQGRNAIEKAKKAGLGQEGSISLGVIESQLSENFLPYALNTLRDHHPNIQLQLIRGTFKELRDVLLKGEIDIALTMDFDLLEYPDTEVIYQPFFQASPKCVISTSHPLAKKDYIHLEELKNEPMIAIKPEISQGAYDHIVQLCEIHGFIPEQVHYATSIQNLLLMVESGLGFSVLDDNCISSTNVSVRSIPIYKSDPLILVAVWKRDNFNPVIPLFTSLLTADQENTVS